MSKLTMAERRALPKSDFAVPSKAPFSGSFPIPDKEHALVAEGLAAMHDGPVAAVEKKVHAKFGSGPLSGIKRK